MSSNKNKKKERKKKKTNTSAEGLGFPFSNTNPLIIFKIIDMTFVPGNHPAGAFTVNSTRRPSFQMIEHTGNFVRIVRITIWG